MKKMLIAMAVASLLAACGGGSNAGNANEVAPAPAPAAAPAPAQSDTGTAPVLSASAVRMSNAATMNTDNMTFVLSYSATNEKNLTLNGNNNRMWVAEGQTLSTVSISGTGNTVVFMAAATAASLTVSAGNVVYLPLGSPTTVLGSGATVKYYTN